MTEKTFKELEHGGWMDRAAAYDSYFGLLTNQAIDTILDSFGTLQGKRLLDVGCGTGHLSAAAAKRGAEIEGIDFASAMVAIAAANYPEVTFTQGDAEDLRYEEGYFDCVACSFGLLHMQHQKERWRRSAGFCEAPGAIPLRCGALLNKVPTCSQQSREPYRLTERSTWACLQPRRFSVLQTPRSVTRR